VSRLVLIDAAGYPFTPKSVPLGFQMARMPVVNRVMQLVTPRFVVADSVRNVYGEPGLVTEALIDRYFDLTLRAGNRAALGARFAQLSNDADQLASNAARIKQIKQPTLVLWGELDRLIPPEHAQAFKRDIASAQLVTFAKLGHVPHEEGAAQTLAAFNSFLQNK
jgi:pimeloyl-ACP methyl ester carboxylesterase